MYFKTNDENMTSNSWSRREHECTVMSLKLIFDDMTVWAELNFQRSAALRRRSSQCQALLTFH